MISILAMIERKYGRIDALVNKANLAMEVNQLVVGLAVDQPRLSRPPKSRAAAPNSRIRLETSARSTGS